MKRLIADEGFVRVEEAAEPALGEHDVRIRTEYSAISTGTETMHLRNKSKKVPLGYSAVGIVEELGAQAAHVRIGQRVAVYGVPSHADIIFAPKHLTVPVPDEVDAREAAFAGLGAIAIHALRQADLRFGETAVVVGLGILGQLIVDIGHAAAFSMFGLDRVEQRCRRLMDRTSHVFAASTAEELNETLRNRTDGRGADTVLVCAGSENDTLLDQSIEWLRDRGRIVIVGVPNTTFNRNALFRKEADIRISRAGGPGRYDAAYEKQGFDYPVGYVRWTEGRNTEAFIRLLAERRIAIRSLLSDIYSLEEAPQAYQRSLERPGDQLGMLIRFGG